MQSHHAEVPAGVLDDLADQSSRNSVPSIPPQRVYVSNAPEPVFRLVGIMADAADGNQALAGKSPKQQFAGTIKPFRAVDPVLAQSQHEFPVTGRSFFNDFGEEGIGIMDRMNFKTHRVPAPA